MKIIIKDLTLGVPVNGELLLKSAQVRQTKNGKDYVDSTYTDGTRDINVKQWDCSEAPVAGVVYTLSATVGEYLGAKQLTLSQAPIRSNLPVELFAATRDYDIESAWDYLCDTVYLLPDPFFSFAKELMLDKKEDWCKCTAAVKMHHVQAGGLVQHTAEVVTYASVLSHNCNCNAALVRCGALLHDIGKLETYACNKAAQFERTFKGVLSEHIALGVGMLRASEAAKRYPNVAKLLEHIIVSHHGKLEWGSPVEPMCPEAIIVHTADNLSATLDTLDKVYEEYNQDWKLHPSGEPTMLTEKVFGYNRQFITPEAITYLIALDTPKEEE